MKKLVTGLCLMLFMSGIAFASSLDTAKRSGLVGERNDGYLGYVVKPASNETKTLVKEVNNKRKAKFSQSANTNGLKTGQVANRFYQRAVGATLPGNYYQDATGAWVKK